MRNCRIFKTTDKVGVFGMLRDIRNMIIATIGRPIDETRLPSVRYVSVDPASVKNILVVRLGALGDAVLSTPCVSSLRQHFSHANITIMLSSYNKVIYEGNSHVDDTIVYGTKGGPRGFRDRLRFFADIEFLADIRKRHFDLVVALYEHTVGYWTAFLSGAKHRVSTFSYHHGILALTARSLLSIRIPYESDSKELDKYPRRIPHEVERCLSMIRPFGVKASQTELVLVLSQEDRQFAEDLLQHHGIDLECLPICVHFKRRWFIDGWDKENFYQLIARLPNDIPQTRVIVTLGPFEESARQELQRNVDAIVTDETMTVKEWAAVIERCRLVITPDTGTTHIASAMRTPVVLVLEQKGFCYYSQRWRPWRVPYIIVKKQLNGTEIADDALISARKQAVIADIINAAERLLQAGNMDKRRMNV